MRIVFITPEDVPFGFAIAGFEQLMTDVDTADTVLHQAAAENDVGLIVIDERLLAGVDDEGLRRLQEQWHGILLVLPTPVDAVPAAEDYLQGLIRRALGYHVRIRE